MKDQVRSFVVLSEVDHRNQESFGRKSPMVSFDTSFLAIYLYSVLDSDGSKFIVSTMEELQFSPMRKEDGSDYECSAENGVGSSLSQTDHSFSHWYNF